MAKVLQYKLTKTDSKPWLFSDEPVSAEYVESQRELQEMMNNLQRLTDTVIGENQVTFTKICEDNTSASRFILTLSSLQLNYQSALDQAEQYHTLEFVHSSSEE
jgi:hypothetical protein